MAISNLESAQSLFVGQGDLILFELATGKTYENISGLADLVNPKSLGQIHEDSSDWTGDDVSVEEIRDEQGDLITATVSAGTLAFEFNIASTSQTVIETFLKGVGISSAALTSVFGSAEGTTVSAVGFGVDLPVITRPIGWLNDEKKRLLLFPKGKITSNLTINDGLLEVHCAVLAEYIDLADLKTGMVFSSNKEAVYEE